MPKHDRYKASSYRSYNGKMPGRYDTCIWMKFCQVERWDRAVLDVLRPQIDSVRILDVGCATGRLLERLAAAGATRLAGTDLAPRILDVAADKLARSPVVADLQAADAEDRLPWDPGSFDVVTMSGVLHHFYRPGDALSEVHRVLRSRGRLLIMDPWFPPLVRQILNAALRVAPHDGDFRFYSPREAADLVARSGFEVSWLHRIGAWGFMIQGIKLP